MKNLIILLMLSICITAYAGERQSCELDGSTFLKEQDMTERNQEYLLKNRPPIKLTDSLERKQINMRTELWNNPSKVAYLYVFTHGGACIGFHVIKGKISSVNSQITNPMQIKVVEAAYHDPPVVIPSPAEDGSYGSNGDGIFFFGTDGGYNETNMDYYLSDKPLKLKAVQLN